MARNVEIQANNLVARLADRIGGNYELLHVPDNLSNAALETILNEKDIKNVIVHRPLTLGKGVVSALMTLNGIQYG